MPETQQMLIKDAKVNIHSAVDKERCDLRRKLIVNFEKGNDGSFTLQRYPNFLRKSLVIHKLDIKERWEHKHSISYAHKSKAHFAKALSKTVKSIKIC